MVKCCKGADFKRPAQTRILHWLWKRHICTSGVENALILMHANWTTKYDSICGWALALAMSRTSSSNIHLPMWSLLPKRWPASPFEHFVQIYFGPCGSDFELFSCCEIKRVSSTFWLCQYCLFWINIQSGCIPCGVGGGILKNRTIGF